jgi:hypothetical protein
MLDANIEPTELAQKETAFMAYAAYDGGVCQTLEDCYANTAYGYYLPRQYTAEQYQATLDSLGL